MTPPARVQGCFRWIVAQKNRVRNGELYRYVADSRGAFVQPALYEGARCAAERRARVFLRGGKD